MKKFSLSLIFVAAGIASGCGARTSEDDLLGPYSPRGDGDGDGDGDTGGFSSTGGWLGSGGFLGSGGRPGSGGIPGSGGVVGTGGSVPPGNCCAATMGPGCEEPAVQDCVCSFDAFCCEQTWDQACVDEADRFCRGNCSTSTGGAPGVGGDQGTGGDPGVGGAPTGGVPGVGGTPSTGGRSGTGGTPGGDCCESHDGQGCQVPSVQMCVCGIDPYCCENRWDQICANEAADECDANCVMGTGGAPSSGGAPSTGGAPGTGGMVDQCEQIFDDECGQCLCGGCFEDLNNCLGDFGCLAILACLDNTGCNGFNCYQPSTCQNVIDQFGGLGSASTQNAFLLGACAVASGCDCN